MYKYILVAFSLFLLVNKPIIAQVGNNKEEKPYIEVEGTAELEVLPDEIYIGIVVLEKYDGRNKISVEERENSLKNALQSIGIDLSDLYLSDQNADYIKVKWRKKDVIIQKNYTLKVNNALAVSQVFQIMDNLDLKNGYISRVHHSKMDSLKKQVKIMAIKATKAKAEYLLTAIGEKVGKPLIIRENNGDYPNIYSNMRAAEPQAYFVDGVKVEKENDEIQFQKIKLNSSVYIKFEIE